jgi:hypothetical protein
MSKGEDFESAFLWEGQSRQVAGASRSVQSKYDSISADVKNAAAGAYNTIVRQLGITTPQQQDVLGATFIKVGNIRSDLGGPTIPPKTDIKFSYNGNDYKCSLKYGYPYQLSSAKQSTQQQVFAAVIRNIFLFGPDLQADQGAVDLLEILLALDDMGIADRMEQTVAQNQLDLIRGSGGLQSKLQEIVGGGTNPDVSPIYRLIKTALIRETLTGQLQFGGGDGTANYILMGESGRFLEFVPITNAYVENLLHRTKARISAKGRSPTRAEINSGVDPRARYQEIGIRLDVVRH